MNFLEKAFPRTKMMQRNIKSTRAMLFVLEIVKLFLEWSTSSNRCAVLWYDRRASHIERRGDIMGK